MLQQHVSQLLGLCLCGSSVAQTLQKRGKRRVCSVGRDDRRRCDGFEGQGLVGGVQLHFLLLLIGRVKSFCFASELRK